MDEIKQDSHMVCNCPMCRGMGRYGHGHWVLRWLLGLVILFLVFWFGVKIGELKSGFGYGYEHHGMMMQHRTMQYFPQQRMGIMPNMMVPQGMMASSTTQSAK